MNHRVWLVLFASLFIAAVVFTAHAAEKPEDTTSGLPPLVIDRGTPLLLDEPPEEDPFAVPSGPIADNQSCFVCHTNYEEEEFADVHAKANVGCIKCHGASFDHRNDENNITPPDVMFDAKKMKKNCEQCHDTHDAPAMKVIVRWQERCPSKTDPKDLLCTDCHGMHRLAFRTVQWDKKTGELIVRKVSEPGEQVEKKPEMPEKDQAAESQAAESQAAMPGDAKDCEKAEESEETK